LAQTLPACHWRWKWDDVGSVELSEQPATAVVEAQGRTASALAVDMAYALAEQPRILICDLSGVSATGREVRDVLEPLAGYLIDWPGAGIVVRSQDPVLRAELCAVPLTERIVVNSSRAMGLAELLPRLPRVQRVQTEIGASLTAPVTARKFTATTMLEWGLPTIAGPAALAVSELVTRTAVHAAAVTTLTLSRANGRIQVALLEHGDDARGSCTDHIGVGTIRGRGLLLLHGVTRGWGVFPSRNRRRLIWAVLDDSAAFGSFGRELRT
jgi:hypothetical protein